MSLRKLFETGKKSLKTAPLASFKEFLEDVESIEYVHNLIDVSVKLSLC